jgi:hypothetical protein
MRRVVEEWIGLMRLVSPVSVQVKKEGFGAFFKGLTPKLAVVGPKLVFSFTVAQQLMSIFEKSF